MKPHDMNDCHSNLPACPGDSICPMEPALSQERLNRMNCLGYITSGIGHEVNNCVNVSMLNAPLLMDVWRELQPILDDYAERNPQFRISGLAPGELGVQMPQLLSGMLKCAESVKDMMGQLTRFAWPPMNAKPVAINLNRIVKDTTQLIQFHTRTLRSNIQLELEENLPDSVGVPSRLELVIANLLLLACRLDRSGQHRIHASTSSVGTTGVQCCVTIGLDPADQPDPRWALARCEGRCTELDHAAWSVIEGIVRDHGGTITADRPFPNFSTARVFLPLSQNAAEGRA